MKGRHELGIGGALISGGAALAGDLFGLGAQSSLQREQWRREDTAVRRRVADLRAAGLSPTLAVGSAAGSSAPINVMGQFSSMGERVGKTIEGAMELQAQKIGLRKLSAEAGRSEADRRRAEADATIRENEAEYVSTFPWARKESYLNRDTMTGSTRELEHLRKLIAEEGWSSARSESAIKDIEARLLRLQEGTYGAGHQRGLRGWVETFAPLLNLIMR